MGEVFAGRYELADLLGTGGMGAVWRAWDRRTQTYVAAKVLQQRDSASLLRFMREQAMRIEDPHVVTPLGWAGEDDRVLFTMPLVRGGSVATLLGDFGPLPQRWVSELLRQLLAALAAVHQAGVVHRDVKPGNLLLNPTGTARPFLRLSDFGIALPLAGPRLTRTDVVIGTAGYLSPEVAQGAEPTPAQDLYAAGRVGIAMLTGVDAGRADWAEGVHPALVTLIGCLTQVDPQQRPADGSAAVGLATSLGLPDWVNEDDGVEVFEHVSAPPLAPPGALAATPERNQPTAPWPAPTREAESPTVREAPPTPRAEVPNVAAGPPPLRVGEQAGSPPPRTRETTWRLVLATGALLGTIGLVVLLVARPWSSPTPVTPGQTASSSPTSDDELVSPAATLPPAAPPLAPPTGSSYAGDECSFADVGVRETAPDGAPITCEQQDDGTYRWVSAG